jgi:hypothetical protein
MGHGTKVKHNIARALPLPPYWERIGTHVTLIMANPLTIGWVFNVKCASHTNWEFAQSDQFAQIGVYIGKVKMFKAAKHVESKSVNFSLFLITQILDFTTINDIQDLSFVMRGLLSEPRGAQKFMNYVWNSDEYKCNQSFKR